MKRILIFMADGVEEVEGFTVVDLLRRQKCDVDMASITDSLTVTGSHGIVFSADKKMSECDFDSYDALVIPGGLKGTANLKQEPEVLNAIRSFNEKEKLVCAICAGPTVLAAAGITKGRCISCYPGKEDELAGGYPQPDREVSVDRNMITSRGMGTSIAFGLAIIEYLFDREAAEEMKQKIVFNVTG